MRMNYLLILIFSSTVYLNLNAQNNGPITVKAGSTIKESVPFEDLFEYPQFIHGTITFANGKISGANLNFNRYLDMMQFINVNKDTLVLNVDNPIQLVNIGKDTFYFNDGFIKSIYSTPKAKLAVKKVLTVTDKQKIGGYGMANPTSSIESYSAFNDGMKTYNLTVEEDIILSRKEQYFIGDADNHFVLASKKNVLNLFPNQQQSLQTYIKENKTDFRNKESLEKLLQVIQ
jgi:hypothetical protein